MWKYFEHGVKAILIEATKIALQMRVNNVGLAHCLLALVRYVQANTQEREMLALFKQCVDSLIPLCHELEVDMRNASQSDEQSQGNDAYYEAALSLSLRQVLRFLLINRSKTQQDYVTVEDLLRAILGYMIWDRFAAETDPELHLVLYSNEAQFEALKRWVSEHDDGSSSQYSEEQREELIPRSHRKPDEEDGSFLDKVDDDSQDAREEYKKRVRENERLMHEAGRHRTASVGRKRSRARSILDEFGTDLVEQARQGLLDPVVARDEVIEEVIVKLMKFRKNNPLLIGEPGVGKTAVVQGVAMRIAEGSVPAALADVSIMNIDVARLVAGTRYRGEFEERFKDALKAVMASEGKIILFIDEIHTIIGAGGSSEGSLDAANMLKPVLTDTRFRCIGATTQDEYSKVFEKDHALDRRFMRIVIDEPSFDGAVTMLKGLRERYTNFHRVSISDEAIKLAVRLSSRYISDRKLPDKAIDLLDEAASRARLEYHLANQIEKVKAEDDEADKGEQDDVNSAAAERPILELTPEHIATVVSMHTGVPLQKLTESDQQRLLNIEEILHRRVIGQNEPIRIVSEAIWRARAGNRDSKRPIGSFLFLGPTGVGKTELAKTLAEYLFFDENALVRIDMSEYSEKYSVSRLLGASPGYVGYEEGGQLDVLRHKPYAVVLFDEVEKAHPEIFGSLLQIMDEGSLTDSQGRHIDFKNTLIIMTSNLGFGEVEEKSFGFRANRNNEDAETRYKIMYNRVMETTKDFFRPEFLNRLDASVVFHSLEPEHLKQIIDIMIGKLNEELAVEERVISLTSGAKERIVNSCDEPQYGARPLRRAIRDMVETPMAKEIISGNFPANSAMRVTVDRKDETKLRFVPVEPRSAKAKERD